MKKKPATKKTIVSIVGTRPNFMKIAPVVKKLAVQKELFNHVLIHTGQHYDRAMSDVFFTQLAIPAPDIQLSVGSGSHAYQTAEIMKQLEPIFLELNPDLVLVPGDVNSTLAAALVAAKLNIPIGHIEAGLRSNDRTMPEEINRIVTDSLSSLLFTHSPDARKNLEREGTDPTNIYEVGNTMIDTLVAMKDAIRQAKPSAATVFQPHSYIVVTLHRPALVDSPLLLAKTIEQLLLLAKDFPIIFPIHPRTYKKLQQLDVPQFHTEKNILLTEPLGYLEFLHLVSNARAVLTDSGGIQEESTFLGVPCFTLRDNTERPITVEMGTNTLLGLDPEKIREIPDILRATIRNSVQTVSGWDGDAADRILNVINHKL